MRYEDVKPIYLARYGSHAYGTSIEGSDVDLRGIFIADKASYLGFGRPVEQVSRQDEVDDVVLYEVRKFFRLAADCNPSTMEILFVDDGDVLEQTPLGERLRAHRRAFLSQKVRHTFGGYAHQQLKRIQTHYRWLKSPPSREPVRADYDLPERTAIPKEQMQAASALIAKRIDGWAIDYGDVEPSVKIHVERQVGTYLAEIVVATGGTADSKAGTDHLRSIAAARLLGFDDNFLALIDREKRYRGARAQWRAFQTWQKTRNPKRAALEAQFGYDTKHAMHLVRLLRMAEELLTTGEVLVRRPDAEELLAIRTRGIWSYDELVEWAKAKDALLDDLVRRPDCPLPKAADKAALQDLCVDLIETALAVA